MSNNKLELTLILKPVKKIINNVSTIVEPEPSDAWLENNDTALLQMFSDAKKCELNAIVEKLTSTNVSAKKQYYVETIKIKQNLNGFALMKEQDLIDLENGDVIVTDAITFEVEIKKQQLVQNPDLAMAEADAITHIAADIWDFSKTESLAKILPQQENLTDPLNFLFGTGAKQNNKSLSLIPSSNGMGSLPFDSIATLQSPMPTISIQRKPENNPSISSNTKVCDKNSTVLQENILQDLGINGTTTLIMPITKSLANTAPIDSLDEFLNDAFYENY